MKCVNALQYYYNVILMVTFCVSALFFEPSVNISPLSVTAFTTFNVAVAEVEGATITFAGILIVAVALVFSLSITKV